MVNAGPRSLRKHFVVVGYVAAACVGVPLLIYGFMAWRDEGFYFPHKHSALEGRGAGFYMLLLGFMLVACAALGLQYHFTRVDRPSSDTDRDDTTTI
jgi:hypothetical protein